MLILSIAPPALAQKLSNPVAAIELNEDWNVISRTILPVVYQDDMLSADQWGAGPMAVVCASGSS
ncbi:MAG: hypothetical protein Q8N51_11155 [Gammaproteobacteria bacterium]|nr:hypothetical protein [Gammaproteobacteria bacterium]